MLFFAAARIRHIAELTRSLMQLLALDVNCVSSAAYWTFRQGGNTQSGYDQVATSMQPKRLGANRRTVTAVSQVVLVLMGMPSLFTTITPSTPLCA